MALRRFTIRSSHLLMWSSPLLLLVLVFTLNSRPLTSPSRTTTILAATTPSRPRPDTTTTGGVHPTTTVPTTTIPATTVPTTTPSRPRPDTTTTNAQPTPSADATTTTGGVHPTTTVPTTTVPTTTPSRPRPDTTTTNAQPTPSADATTTSVVANAHAADASIDGNLTLATPAALVPLRGPGRWTLETTHAVATTLLCGSRSAKVFAAVLITQSQKCLLDINIATGAPTTWTLTAAW